MLLYILSMVCISILVPLFIYYYIYLCLISYICRVVLLSRGRSLILPGEGLEDIWEGGRKFCLLRRGDEE